MKTRTCPHCDYRYSLRDYTRLLFKLLWSEWNCKNCNNPITFNPFRRIWVSFAFGLWLMILLIFKDNIAVTAIWWLLFILLLIGGTFFIYAFDTFEKVN